jgi:hypothetical protein
MYCERGVKMKRYRSQWYQAAEKEELIEEDNGKYTA